MKSVWEEGSQKKFGEKLDSNIERDIVVVGGGIAGVLVAHKLATRGFSVTILEADKIFGGVTKNTTAHITANQGYMYLDLPIKSAKLYYLSQKQAVREFEDLIKSENIDCDFYKVNDYKFSVNQPKKLKKLYDVLNQSGAKVTFKENGELLGIKAKGIITMKGMAMFNPIKFLHGLNLENTEIYEDTRVLKVDLKTKTLYTEKNKITANKIIIATNYPIVNIKNAYFLKLYKSQSYVATAKTNKKINGLYSSDIDSGLTFRNYKDLVVIGGLDHRTGRIDSGDDKHKRMKEIAKQHFNSDEVKNFWTANDCMTYDSIPLAGRFSSMQKDVYVITGFNKWGMANSMICAGIVSDLISEKENEFVKLFSPLRSRFSLGGFLSSMGVSLKYLVSKHLTFPAKSYAELKNDEGKIVNYEGKKAVYKDEKGELSVCSPYCKHMGCEMTFNSNVKTWDCPCHGSRYDLNGKIITAPTVYELDNFNDCCKDKETKKKSTSPSDKKRKKTINSLKK